METTAYPQFTASYAMSQVISCPHCAGQVRDDGNMPGQNASCPHCRGVFQMPSQVVQVAPHRAVSTESSPLDFSSGRPSTAVQINIREREGSAHSIGVASLVLGVVGLFLFWMPAIGFGLSAFGAIIGLVAIVVSAARRGRGVGFGIAGLLLSIAGCAVGGFVTSVVGATGMAISESVKQFDQAEAKKENAPWVDSAHPARVGDMAIQVRSASIERPKMLSYGERVEATEDALVIKILVANFSAGKKVDYSSLGTSSGMEFFESVSATDSFGNHLHKLRLGLSAKLEGSADSGSIYPGKSVLDVIALELPVPNAKYVRLQISGSTMGEAKGDFRIQIPASRIKH